MVRKIFSRFFRLNSNQENEHFLLKPLKKSYIRALKSGAISEAEATAVKEAIYLLQGDDLVFVPGSGDLAESLERYWSEKVTPRRQQEIRHEALRKAYDDGIRFYIDKPDWLVGLTDDFVKSISDLDKKLQGRVLEAIAKITKDPVRPVGDTVKPLTGNSIGLWRYRIGDYRLIYQPDVKNSYIILISFQPRGGAYG